MENRTSKSSGLKNRIRSALSLLPSSATVVRAMKRATSRVPFMDEVLAMYYCAVDAQTPRKVRIVVGATLLYLVMPLDFIPDFLALVGYTDDVTALMVLVRLVSSHVTDAHRERARESLAAMKAGGQADAGAAA